MFCGIWFFCEVVSAEVWKRWKFVDDVAARKIVVWELFDLELVWREDICFKEIGIALIMVDNFKICNYNLL